MRDKPNLLLIVIDQFRGDLLSNSPLGRAVHLPNLRKLMQRSTTFSQHFSVVAPCGPSRASLFTGQYAMTHGAVRNGTPLRHDTPNLARSMREIGYAPWLFGYTDTAQDPRALDPDDPRLFTYEEVMPGFDELVSMRLESDDRAWRTHLAAKGQSLPPYPDTYRPDGPDIDDPAIYSAEDSDTAFLTDRFLDHMAQAQPGWFATLTYIRPHPPLVAPAPYNRMYRPADMPAARSANAGDWHPFLAPARAKQPPASMVVGFPHLEASEDTTARLRALYLALATEVDHHIGRVIDWLEASGQWDNTVLVVTADHGEMLGDYDLWGKGAFYDAAFHVPLIIHDPARPEGHGREIHEMTESIDVPVTLLRRFGAPVPDSMAGESLLSCLDGQATSPRASVSEYDFGNPVQPTLFMDALGLSSREANLSVLRTNSHRMVEFAGDLPPILFDMRGQGEAEDVSTDAPDALLDMTRKMLRHRMVHTDGMFARTMIGQEGVRTGSC